MEWSNLLSHERLGRPNAVPEEDRSPFQQDIDRITFSAAFRRLAHKTQVHPLSLNDHVHSRLTHSIEVACVGRSLGTGVGARLKPCDISQDTFGYVVQAACLAHDIGNPPFGHFGEHAIKSWFKEHTKPESELSVYLEDIHKKDFISFDGNAQGFRIITQLEDSKWAGGLRLTYAVLGAFTKYPRASHIIKDEYVGSKEAGFFKSEEGHFTDVANHLGLNRRDSQNPSWCRHPLAFLVEAADDICYRIIDIEDGYELGYLSFTEAKDILASIACNDPKFTTLPAKESDQIGKLRAVAVGECVKECIKVFAENHNEILAGNFGHPLLDFTTYRYKEQMEHAKKVAKRKIFESESITKREITAETVIGGLLDIFFKVVIDLCKKDFNIRKLETTPARLASG
jgi:dGTPase